MTQKKKNSIYEILSLLDPRAYFKRPISDRVFCKEGRFQKELAREKRRTDRSQKPFLLMLIDIKDLVRSKSDVSLIRKLDHNKRIRKVENVLINNTREVDLKGWYESYRIVGVIITEIDNLDRNFLTNKIYTKLYDVFCTELSYKITISSYMFPQEFTDQTDINKRA
jgi:hypothetical protein